MRVELLVIDPQVDFCDPQKGKLYVGGAENDIQRLAEFVRTKGHKLDDIHVTLDSHNPVDIAHPIWWKDAQGNHPNPFTIITTADLANGTWTTTQPGLYKRTEAYIQQLEANQRYPLCVWPEHCLIGSEGATVMPELFEALCDWGRRENALVDYVTKGSNPYTEHYSAVKADVPDPSDPSTQINTALIQTLMKADLVAIAGEAGSHCVANTVTDIADAFGDDSYVKKLVLLTDAISPVGGFESFQTDFIAKMTARGMQLATTQDFLS